MYVYDNIGNRKTAITNFATWTYPANQLNQYTNISNGFDHDLFYDADGNLTNDGVRAYTWNDENRLLTVTNADDKVEFTYDYMGRRHKKVVYERSGGSWSPVQTNLFVYDGWNPIQETVISSSGTVTNWYVWGLDLSGSMQGAGGIGGLLSRTRSAGNTEFYFYDANGNVAQLVDTNGAKTATYEYDPFGRLRSSSGDNPFKFSTKYFDDESELAYYGYRYHSPELGRFVSRDPLGDEVFFVRYTAKEFKNLSYTTRQLKTVELRRQASEAIYIFVDNDPASRFDAKGLLPSDIGWERKQTFPFGGDPYPHWALTLYGTEYGFGPVTLVRGTTTGYEETMPPYVRWPLVEKKQWGQLVYGSVKKKCCNATKSERIACAEHYKSTWDNSPYVALVRDCKTYVKHIIYKCCLRRRRLADWVAGRGVSP